jgi:hypothetical protein
MLGVASRNVFILWHHDIAPPEALPRPSVPSIDPLLYRVKGLPYFLLYFIDAFVCRSSESGSSSCVLSGSRVSNLHLGPFLLVNYHAKYFSSLR